MYVSIGVYVYEGHSEFSPIHMSFPLNYLCSSSGCFRSSLAVVAPDLTWFESSVLLRCKLVVLVDTVVLVKCSNGSACTLRSLC